ncbi:hypothetical protein [Polaromonas sp. CG_9.11]|uniref:hypothetical protein n=1 Tax=Polaromonas sp. CG_9.11 TaxID=2787730 RepID=UPI001E341C79|nr:hypothetical protein [Polaromonas sp. CG_9.11]
MKRHCLAMAALAAALLLHAPLRAQEAAKPVPTQASRGANNVTQAAVAQGVLNCAARINQVSSFVGYTAQAGALLMIPPAQPDQRLIPLALEVPSENGSAYVSAAFAPNQANGCGAAYDAVVYWPQRCEAVANRQFAGLKRVGLLKTSITVLDGGESTKVFLMPAGSGCVSIKKEVVL